MYMKRTALVLAIATVLMPSISVARDKVKACFIYGGPIGDSGWSYQHHQSALAMQKALGQDKVEIAYLENVEEGPAAERAIERLARSGCTIIFTTSFDFMDQTNKVAGRFPDVKFDNEGGYKREHPNVSTYNLHYYEGHYVEGVIAASTSKAGVAGFIASFPIPEEIIAINSFMLGAQSVNPDFKLKVVWVNAWFDPGKEADATKALADQGVDVVSQQTDSTAPMQIAAERGIKAFGLSSDMTRFGPKTQLTAVVNNWAPYYIDRVKAVLDGTLQQVDFWGDIATGNVVMAPFANMPDEAKQLGEATEARIKAGSFHPFTGPISRQDGTVWLKAGEAADESTLQSMNFYVKGIDDKLPQ